MNNTINHNTPHIWVFDVGIFLLYKHYEIDIKTNTCRTAWIVSWKGPILVDFLTIWGTPQTWSLNKGYTHALDPSERPLKHGVFIKS